MTELENSNHSENTQKERHGCVTIWFILLIIVNTCVCAVYVFATDEIAKLIPIKLPTNLFYVLSIFSCMNVVFVILLIKWKRHGFLWHRNKCISKYCYKHKNGYGYYVCNGWLNQYWNFIFNTTNQKTKLQLGNT